MHYAYANVWCIFLKREPGEMTQKSNFAAFEKSDCNTEDFSVIKYNKKNLKIMDEEVWNN